MYITAADYRDVFADAYAGYMQCLHRTDRGRVVDGKYRLRQAAFLIQSFITR